MAAAAQMEQPRRVQAVLKEAQSGDEKLRPAPTAENCLITVEIGKMSGKKLLRFFIWYVLLPASLLGWVAYCYL